MPPRPASASNAAMLVLSVAMTISATLASAPARADEDACLGLTADLRGLTMKYQRIMADMQGARRALAYLPRGEEAVLRTVGRFATLTAAARAERERILSLYRAAVAEDCWQFEQTSLEQTAETFARATHGEEETLTGTRRVLSGIATVVK